MCRFLASTVAVTVAGTLPGFLVGALAVQLRDYLDFDAAGQGLAVGIFFLAGALSSAVLGHVVETVGAERAMRFAAGANGLLLIVIARAVDSWSGLVAILALGGMMNSLAQPASNLLLARSVRPGRQGLAFGIKQSGVPLATLLGGLAVPTLALTVGWRWAFVAGAVLCVAAVVLVPPARRVEPASPREGRRREGDVPLGPLVVLSVGIGFGAAAAGAMAAFLVTGGVHAGLADGVAGLTLTIGSAVGIAVRLGMGARADRRGGGHLRTVAFMMLGGAVAFVLFSLDISWLYLVVTPLGFGAGWAWPGLYNFSIVRNNPNAPGAATGITQTGTYLGAVLGPLVFGAVVESTSYSTAWLVASTWFILAAGATLIGRQLMIRARGRPETPSHTIRESPWPSQ